MHSNFDPLPDQETQPQPRHPACGNLFGCGNEKDTDVLGEDIKDTTVTTRAADRLRHTDEVS